MIITGVIITLSGISIYFLLKPPENSQNEPMLCGESISEFNFSSDGTTEKTVAKKIR